MLTPIIRNNNLFNDFFEEISKFEKNFNPSLSLKENDDKYVLEMELPGVKKEDIKIEVNKNILTVSGKKEEKNKEENSKFIVRESSFGEFSRSVNLGDNVDLENIEANMKDGELILTIPKKETKEIKKIEIK